MAETVYEANDANAQNVAETADATETKAAQTPSEAMWYVVHTYSGYENKVMENIKKYVKNNNKEDLIPDVMIPMAEVVEAGASTADDSSAAGDGAGTAKKEPKKTKLFPGYVFIKMVMNAETWYVVRNTRGVTGFVGPASEPSPLTNEDLKRMGLVKRIVEEIPFGVGDRIIVVAAGAYEGFSGQVISIDAERHKVKVSLEGYNDLTKVELDISDVKPDEF